MLHEIIKRLNEESWVGAIVEQEYAKKLKEHGLKIRPDLIIHIPFDEKHHKSRREGNFAVIELKLKCTMAQAAKDYEHIAEMCSKLDYAAGVFVNIGSSETYYHKYVGINKEKIVAFDVELLQGKVKLTEYKTSNA